MVEMFKSYPLRPGFEWAQVKEFKFDQYLDENNCFPDETCGNTRSYWDDSFKYKVAVKEFHYFEDGGDWMYYIQQEKKKK